MVLLVLGILVAMAMPTWIKARENARQKGCVSNLKQITSAKEQWAMDTKASPTATPDPSDLYGPTLYVKYVPTCPSGGSYTVGDMSTPVTCSRPESEGHVLP